MIRYPIIPVGAAIAVIAAVAGFLAADLDSPYPFCRMGYASLHRPPEAVPESIKRQMAADDHRGLPVSAYELDHIVPLELGGSSMNPANLQLQTWDRARIKDRLENRLHREVCAGDMPLVDAISIMRRFR